MASDSISNFITVIRNAYAASHADCVGLYSAVHEGIAKILKSEGYILDYEVVSPRKGIKQLKLTLKYVDDAPAILGIERISTPGSRAYHGYKGIPKVINGLGISIISSPKGIIHDRTARKEKLGGELLCKVW
jgi:small subunit ribosomal protein S8